MGCGISNAKSMSDEIRKRTNHRMIAETDWKSRGRAHLVSEVDEVSSARIDGSKMRSKHSRFMSQKRSGLNKRPGCEFVQVLVPVQVEQNSQMARTTKPSNQ